jgi:hypothetical protein
VRKFWGFAGGFDTCTASGVATDFLTWLDHILSLLRSIDHAKQTHRIGFLYRLHGPDCCMRVQHIVQSTFSLLVRCLNSAWYQPLTDLLLHIVLPCLVCYPTHVGAIRFLRHLLKGGGQMIGVGSIVSMRAIKRSEAEFLSAAQPHIQNSLRTRVWVTSGHSSKSDNCLLSAHQKSFKRRRRSQYRLVQHFENSYLQVVSSYSPECLRAGPFRKVHSAKVHSAFKS